MSATCPVSTSVPIEVPFHDVDSMGIVWHGHYVKYFEVARTALLRHVGLDLKDLQEMGCEWPVVECRVKYRRPLRYGQKVTVEARLMEYENRLKLDYVIRDQQTREVTTKGTTLQLAVSRERLEVLFESPPALIERIERHLERANPDAPDASSLSVDA